MKISLVGLGGCGKTSLYSVAFAEKSPQETKSLSPTILYETRRHPFLGLQVGIFDFGGQEQYRKEYMDKPEVFRGTDILIPIVDLHDPKSFNQAKEYFVGLLDSFCILCPFLYLSKVYLQYSSLTILSNQERFFP